MKDFTSAINVLATKWHKELYSAITSVLHEEIFDKDFNWLDADDNNKITQKAISTAMPQIWDAMSDEFKKDLLQHVFLEWRPRAMYMAKRRMHVASHSAEWMFRCLLTGFLDSNPHGMIVGGSDMKALHALGTKVESDLKRLFGELIVPEDDPQVRESAKDIIDALVYPQ